MSSCNNVCSPGVNAATAAATTAAVHQSRIAGLVNQVECAIGTAARGEKTSVALPDFITSYSSQLSYSDKLEVKKALTDKGFKVSDYSVSW
ncbi:MAG: hypothetical protein IPJ65_28690 [Archangiaceae bacterium]|nr:hypothetical protein [Archangiaceae bacterium]